MALSFYRLVENGFPNADAKLRAIPAPSDKARLMSTLFQPY